VRTGLSTSRNLVAIWLLVDGVTVEEITTRFLSLASLVWAADAMQGGLEERSGVVEGLTLVAEDVNLASRIAAVVRCSRAPALVSVHISCPRPSVAVLP